jgi:hypothetical protein
MSLLQTILPRVNVRSAQAINIRFFARNGGIVKRFDLINGRLFSRSRGSCNQQGILSMMRCSVDWMVRTFRFSLATLLLFVAISPAVRADFFVLQVGDGSAALNSASTAVFLKKFSNTGTLLQTLNMPTAASGSNLPFTISGTATSEGFLAISPNGNFLTLGGYGTAPGLASVASSSSATVSRVVGMINLSNSTIDTSTSTTAFDTRNIRSAVTIDGTEFWAGGNGFPSGATQYLTYGATTSIPVSTSPTNGRVLKVFENQLYLSTSSAGFIGVNAVGTGIPETEGNTTTLLSGFPAPTTSPSPYDFWFKDSSTLYVTDDSSLANGGGIQKWTLSAGTWSLAYTMQGPTGYRGLTGSVIDGQTVLFATATQGSANRIMTVTDTGASSTFTEIAAAPTNTAFRGIAYVPAAVAGQPGDFDADGDVDGHDFLVWQRNTSVGNLADWQANYGFGIGPLTAVTAVPEPASLAMLGLAIVPVAFGRKR